MESNLSCVDSWSQDTILVLHDIDDNKSNSYRVISIIKSDQISII